MQLSKFLKLASICSLCGALTTILLIYLPSSSATGLEAQAATAARSLTKKDQSSAADTRDSCLDRAGPRVARGSRGENRGHFQNPADTV